MKTLGLILVTGASGFIGQNLMSSKMFDQRNMQTISLRSTMIDDLKFENVSCVIHLAGIAQLKKETTVRNLYDVNHKLTVGLATKAKKAGVSHFVFLSSTKVFGEQKTKYSIKDSCQPEDDYSKSKLFAENDLWLLNDSNFKVTIIRPALVYGSGVKGNLLAMMKLVKLGLPLPFGKMNNTRSMTYVGNLIAFIKHAIDESKVGKYIVTDGADISTTDLVKQLRANMDLPIRLFKIPKILSVLLNRLKPGIYNRLFGTLSYDVTDAYRSIGFSPLFQPEHGLKIMVDHYLNKEEL